MSDGGLICCCLEMAFGGNCGLKLNFSLGDGMQVLIRMQKINNFNLINRQRRCYRTLRRRLGHRLGSGGGR